MLDQALNRLKATGAIEYTGEFGAEITTFIPFAFWLKTQGLLSGRRVITYGGMRPYYYFLDDDEFHEKLGPRQYLPAEQRDWPTNSTYTATKQAWHVVPDYRSRYRSQGREFRRPVLFIQNKFCVEWGVGPLNFLSLVALKNLFSLAGHRFDVVYSRPRPLRKEAGYTIDHNADCDYPDIKLARESKDVLILEDLCAETGAPYNLTKLEILAKTRLFVAVQGGGAHLLACFGNSLLLLLHCDGPEYPHAYASGPYKYLATRPPVLLVARGHIQMLQGVEIFGGLRMEGPQIRINPVSLPTFNALRI